MLLLLLLLLVVVVLDSWIIGDGECSISLTDIRDSRGITLRMTQSEKYRSDYCYLSWLGRCYIMNKKPRMAWELYLKVGGGGD